VPVTFEPEVAGAGRPTSDLPFAALGAAQDCDCDVLQESAPAPGAGKADRHVAAMPNAKRGTKRRRIPGSIAPSRHATEVWGGSLLRAA